MAGADELSSEQLMAMNPQDLEAYGRQLDAGEQPQAQPAQPAAQEQTETPAQEAAETPAQEVAEQATGAEQQPERKGNPDVPLRHLREQVRQYEQFASNPMAMAQQLASLGYQVVPAHQAQQSQAAAAPEEEPDLFTDPEKFVAHHAAKQIAPLQQQLQKAGQYIGQLEAEKQNRAEIERLRGTYGNDAEDHIKQFDERVPGKSHLSPEEKLLIYRGAMASDPNAKKAAVTDEATKLVESKLANLGGSQMPVTLGGIPPAKGHEPGPDIANMSYSDFDKLTPAQIQEMAKRM